jgi:ornithine cyclodeaminase/alanine dehydrogenase
MDELIGAVEAGFAVHARGGCTVPLRQALPGIGGTVLVMSCAILTQRVVGTKVASHFAGNESRGLPTVLATYLLTDPETGATLAVLEGSTLTGLRTGAASGVATKYLARSEAATLGCFGAGVQAGYQVRAVCAVRSIQAVVVVDPRRERAQAFAETMAGRLQIPVRVAADPGEAAAADIVVTATSSVSPVFDGRLLRPGAHINAIGAFTAAMRELDAEAVLRARIVVDTREGALAEAGDLLIPMREGRLGPEAIVAELGELVTGRVVGRRGPEEITLFKSVGFAMEDAVAARLAYERAVRMGVGTAIDL